MLWRVVEPDWVAVPLWREVEPDWVAREVLPDWVALEVEPLWREVVVLWRVVVPWREYDGAL